MQDFDKIFRLTGRVEDILVLKPEDDNMYGSKITRSERTAYRKKVIQAIRSKADSGFKGVNYSTYDEKAWQNLINEVDEALSAGERHFGNSTTQTIIFKNKSLIKIKWMLGDECSRSAAYYSR
jgi:hypothetical protein